MRSTLRERWTAWAHSAERELAPHVEEAWAEALLLELRLQGVDGALIGETLSEVESHCVESGESAQDSFGDPTEYARSLQLPHGKKQTTVGVARATLPTAVQVGAMLVTIWAFAAWADGSDLTVTSGQVVSVGLLFGAIAVLVRLAEKALRLVVRYTVLAILAFTVFVAASVAAQALLRGELATVPAVPVLVTSAALLLGGAVWQWKETLDEDVVDPVTSPLHQENPAATTDPAAPSRLTGAARGFAALTYLVIPVYTVLSIGFTWWIVRS